MSVFKVRALNERADYYIVLEHVDYLKYVGVNSVFGSRSDGHFEVVFNNDGQKQLSISYYDGEKLIEALNALKK